MIAIEARNLSKDFQGEHAVRQLSLRVQEGEVLGLVGPNGAGKTTAMRMLVGLLAPDSGEVRFFGSPFSWREVTPRMQIGWVPQDLAFYLGLTVRENLRFLGSLYGFTGHKLEGRVEEVLETCKMGRFADQPGHTLSGGMQRRLNLGLGLVHEPRVLVLDEPTVGIDSESRSLILRHIRALADSGCAVLLASHYVDEVVATCDRVAVLDRGRLLSCGAVSRRGVPNEIEIVTKQPAQETIDKLRGIPQCNIRRSGSRLKLTLSVPEPSGTVEYAWALSEVLAVLKTDGAEILSLAPSKPDLPQPLQGSTGAVERRRSQGAGVEEEPSSSRRPSRRYRFVWPALALLGILALALFFRPEIAPPESLVLSRRISRQGATGSSISPDGQSLAFQNEDSVWIRSLNQLEPRRLDGTEGALDVFFWSPDSRHLAFVKDGKLWKILVSDASYSVICDLPEGVFRGGSWGRDGTIVFSVGEGVLYQISADGGSPQLLLKRETGEARLPGSSTQLPRAGGGTRDGGSVPPNAR